ncbi:MAG: UDP-3-O-(3-hydroxymyristoyl)glucosamine N-acyltransferase [Ignavibacteria bacterium]|jgi:UDP-3-O-[3-hydroxymyristoyl] glucosamine N-acyltransferase|nr:UDP-3-O-(3-hydroxymyristoyl)glucosamine N-acyltransferase [Ignavibacteria bacterium]
MEIKLRDAADLVGGTVYGNPEITFSGVAKIDEASNGDLTFLYLPAYQKHLSTTRATVVLISPEFPRTRPDLNYIEVKNPNAALQKIIINYFKPVIKLVGIDPSASVHADAKLGENVAVGKNAVISPGCVIGDNSIIHHNTVILENVKIGSNCLIYPNVSVREECVIGDRVIIHSNTVIGSDGFGYIPDEKGVFHKVPQIGNVILEDDVELGSNVSVDRAAMGSTIVKKGVKIDNLVQIAHNVVVGENTVMSAQSGIAGSTKVGKNCMMGGQAGITGHVELGDRIQIGAQSGVSKSLPKSGVYFGSPAIELKTALKRESYIRGLSEQIEKIKKIEEKIASLEQKISELSK